MAKEKCSIALERETYEKFRKLAKQEGVFQDTLLKQMIKLYLKDKESREDEENVQTFK